MLALLMSLVLLSSVFGVSATTCTGGTLIAAGTDGTSVAIGLSGTFVGKGTGGMCDTAREGGTFVATGTIGTFVAVETDGFAFSSSSANSVFAVVLALLVAALFGVEISKLSSSSLISTQDKIKLIFVVYDK